MKIMMLTQFYPPLIGGEERFVNNLSKLLVAAGHSVAVVTLLQDGLNAYEEIDGVRIYRISGFTQRLDFLYSDTSRRAATPFPDPIAVSELNKIIRQENPQIVHAHNWLGYTFLPLKRSSGAKFIVTLHDYSLVCATKKMLYHNEVCSGPSLAKCLSCSTDHYGMAKGVPTTLFNWLSRMSEHRAVDRFVPVSHAVAKGNNLIESDLAWEVIPNFVPDNVGDVPGVETSYLEQLPDEPFLLFVGALGRYKGVDFLIEAYKRLASPPPLVLIGYDTSEYPIQTTDLPRGAMILRNWPHAAVMAAWQRCMIGFAPSMWLEPCATVPMEGMAVGKPIIATMIGGLTDIVADGETGILVEPGNIDALANAIQKLVADDALRTEMGRKGKERVSLFRSSTVVPQYERLYESVLRE